MFLTLQRAQLSTSENFLQLVSCSLMSASSCWSIIYYLVLFVPGGVWGVHRCCPPLSNLPSFQGTRPDHVRVDSSCCCFPRELVSFVCSRKLVSFDPWKVTQSIDGTLIPTAEMTKMKWNGIKDLIILNKIALYVGLQYKPYSGAEWKKICGKKFVTNQNLKKIVTMIGRLWVNKCQLCHYHALSLLFMPNGCNVLALFVKWASRAFLTESRLLHMSSIWIRRTLLIEWPAWLKCSDTGVVVFSCWWFRRERWCSPKRAVRWRFISSMYWRWRHFLHSIKYMRFFEWQDMESVIFLASWHVLLQSENVFELVGITK